MRYSEHPIFAHWIWEKENALDTIVSSVHGTLNRDIFSEGVALAIEKEIVDAVSKCYYYRRKSALGSNEEPNYEASEQSTRLRTIQKMIELMGDEQAGVKIQIIYRLADWEGLLAWGRINSFQDQKRSNLP